MSKVAKDLYDKLIEEHNAITNVHGSHFSDEFKKGWEACMGDVQSIIKELVGDKPTKSVTTGLHVEIKIYCDDEKEVLSHLSVIRRDLKREIKKQKGEIKVPMDFEDSNCYGDHTVIVIPDCTPESGHFPDGNGFCLSCGNPLPIEA